MLVERKLISLNMTEFIVIVAISYLLRYNYKPSEKMVHLK